MTLRFKSIPEFILIYFKKTLMICYLLKFYFDDAKILYGPICDKTCLRGFQQSET